jgi:hypothetical protein
MVFNSLIRICVCHVNVMFYDAGKKQTLLPHRLHSDLMHGVRAGSKSTPRKKIKRIILLSINFYSLRMKKVLVFLSLILIGFVLLCGCSQQSNSALPSNPTQKTEFSMNEMVTDGKLQLTVLDKKEWIDKQRDIKIVSILLRLKNLRSEQPIFLLATDFSLGNSDNLFITEGTNLGDPLTGLGLSPGLQKDALLYFTFDPYRNATKLWYNFGGRDKFDGQVVIFNI